jgi:hypothetical protein
MIIAVFNTSEQSSAFDHEYGSWALVTNIQKVFKKHIWGPLSTNSQNIHFAL